MATTLQDGGSHGSYPAGQKPRAEGPAEIKAQVFREKEARSKVDENRRANGYDAQPKGY